MTEPHLGIAKVLRLRLPKAEEQSPPNIDFPSLLDNCFDETNKFHTQPSYEQLELSDEQIRTALGSLEKDIEKHQCLIIDFSNENATVRNYDKLCWHLYEKLEELELRESHKLDIIIAVSKLGEFISSVILIQRLVESCKSRRVGLIVVAVTPEVKAITLNDSGRFFTQRIDNLTEHFTPFIPLFTTEGITQAIDIIFGHFSISRWGNDLHVPAVVSVERLLHDNRFLSKVYNDLREEFKSDDFCIAYFDSQGELMEQFALGLVDNDSSRLVNETDSLSGKNIALVCDVLWRAYPIYETINRWTVAGAKKVFVLGFAKYMNTFEVPDKQITSYITIRYPDYLPNNCPFCTQGSTFTSGDYFARFADEVGKFDAYTFWELISDVEDGYDGKHWRSLRTGYHYLQTIRTAPILDKHGYGLSHRVWNMIAKVGIRKQWVDNIVITQELESEKMADSLAKLIGLSSEQIIAVPREYFGRITATYIPDELKTFISETYGPAPLDRRNVIILDQAAHHFGTLWALRHLCRFLNARVLAFAVLINRIHASIDINDWLPDAHFISLYEWNWPPFKDDECPCGRTKSE